MSSPKSTPPTQVFVRNASGLVRDVSPLNALYFNINALVGNTVGWIFWIMAFLPGWEIAKGFSGYSLTVIITGIICVLYGLIFSSLTQVFPRSGGDYVFTSRIFGPFWGWLESWTLIWACVALIGFEFTLVQGNIHILARMMEIAYPGSAWSAVAAWFNGGKLPMLVVGLVVSVLCAMITLARVRTFHKIITWAGILATISFVVAIVTVPLYSQADFLAGLQSVAGVTPEQVIATAKEAGWSYGSVDLLGFFGLISVVLFQFIGYQYSAYLGGEVKGNFRKVVQFSTLAALGFAVLLNAFYPMILAPRFGGNELINAWGYLSLNGGAAPMGEIPAVPLLATIARPGAWPLWIVIQLGSLAFNFMLCPIYTMVISRLVLAWSLDRRVPEWFAEVDERTHSPLRATMITVLLGFGFFLLSVFGTSPAATAWYSILLACLTWVFPGLNAIALRKRRSDLWHTAAFRQTVAGLPLLEWFGWLWTIFIVPTYVLSFFWPVFKQFLETPESIISYSAATGLNWAVGLLAVGVVIYFLMQAANRRAGIDTALLYQELPPE